MANATGRYSFRTIVPVPYPGRTPHIHVKVLIGRRDLLTTQLYLSEHPQNSSDFLFRRLAANERRRVSMAVTPRGKAARSEFETQIDLVVDG